MLIHVCLLDKILLLEELLMRLLTGKCKWNVRSATADKKSLECFVECVCSKQQKLELCFDQFTFVYFFKS